MSASVEIASVAALQDRFAALVERAARRAIADRGTFTLAVSGGSAAELLLPRLVRAAVDWRRVDVFWVDERAVPPEAAESNYGAARAVWIDRVALPPDRVHRMLGEAPDLVAAAASYETTLRRSLGSTPAIDVVLLGMGADGHVASLFPGHAALGERRAWTAAVTDAPKPPQHRLTVTLPVLQAARQLVVFATGASKAAPVASALGDPASGLPIALAVRTAARVTLLLDAEAASACVPPIR